MLMLLVKFKLKPKTSLGKLLLCLTEMIILINSFGEMCFQGKSYKNIKYLSLTFLRVPSMTSGKMPLKLTFFKCVCEDPQGVFVFWHTFGLV